MSGAPLLPRLHIPSDPQHGVTVYARRLARRFETAAPASSPRDDDAVHVHFTDRLWGGDPAAAAAAIERLSAERPVTVTLHDLPQPSDGDRGLALRSDCYRRVVRAATGTVCNSAHELTLLRRFADPQARAAVIPLPVDPAGLDGCDDLVDDGAASVSILGFVYPGKGHERAVRAAAGLVRRHPRIRVEALGRASNGHEADAAALERLACESGVGFELTGYLSDADLLERCRRAAVPLIAHEHVSASGSLASWLEAGRRPVVVRSPYMEEMHELHGGALTLVEAVDLADAIGAALDDPASTRLSASDRLGPDLAATADSYRRFWAEVLG